MKISSYIKGMRLHGLKSLLYEACSECNLKLTITDEDKGWLSHFITFDVEGNEDDLRRFSRGLKKIAGEHND